MRGNPGADGSGGPAQRSIPAHAGKPPPSAGSAPHPPVYPRACGETCACLDIRQTAKGLSPRMRGNRPRRHDPGLPAGSIPAHAGKPPCTSRTRWRSRVYPRACGETLAAVCVTGLAWGLSPRMRGNRARRSCRCDLHGSIPAHAGKPRGIPASYAAERVYPRACGETDGRGYGVPAPRGLSPRMRGNRRLPARRLRLRGSIPAHAGKPGMPSDGAYPYGVYPRACGETVPGSGSGAVH